MKLLVVSAALLASVFADESGDKVWVRWFEGNSTTTPAYGACIEVPSGDDCITKGVTGAGGCMTSSSCGPGDKVWIRDNNAACMQVLSGDRGIADGFYTIDSSCCPSTDSSCGSRSKSGGGGGNGNGGSDDNTVMIFGIVVGVLAVCCICAVAVFYVASGNKNDATVPPVK